MKQHYHEILAALGLPQWFDEHGVPRGIPFAPHEVANIYADQVLLVRIRCQNCGYPFRVAFSESWGGATRERIMRGEAVGDPDSLPRLFDDVADVHYGDPPNIRCCPAGPTMNSEPVRVIEAWELVGFEWRRRPDLEIDLDES